ncbi:hypothetical protein BKD30_06415 [Tersicoccus phoenicis]|uniref:Uncharacterized protein n=1 Tax=Tersicoccus phoenicis TaxID=554083 RepID=A0A1R1LCE5_9MICC|nr:hypothetical protein [Tersicoccus phoenicis]OMH25177.1 hypothetical protein BKD30_06415 [Tersicoccus phoenicis]
MGVEWAESADRHSIAHQDAIYAITHAEGSEEQDDGVTAFVGHPHGKTDRYLEVLVRFTGTRGIRVFHVMDLSDNYRHLLNEGTEDE